MLNEFDIGTILVVDFGETPSLSPANTEESENQMMLLVIVGVVVGGVIILFLVGIFIGLFYLCYYYPHRYVLVLVN